MSNFRALNIVYEDESEEEIDDSKELQIEEALKLYQIALKLHSQGPAFYNEAEIAYKELLKSEVFNYAESLSESRWLELYGDTEPVDDGIEEDPVAELPGAPAGGEGAPSTLPQILYLAYKNHGQFRLDRLREQLSKIERDLRGIDAPNIAISISDAASMGLQHLAEALDRDENDLELWRKVARVGEFLGSQRIARFSLETVLDNDETEPLSLEEAFASEQLRPLLASISDRIGEQQFQQISGKQQTLVKALRKHIDPFPFLPAASARSLAQTKTPGPSEQGIEVPLRTWASCGAAILFRQKAESLHRGEKGALAADSGARYFLNLPARGTNDLQPLSSNDSVNGGTINRPVSEVADSHGPRSALDDELNITDAEISNSPTKADVDILEPATKSSTSVDPSIAGLQPLSAKPDDNSEDRPEAEPIESPTDAPTGLPSRKRSVDTAELADGVDVGRSRSKRIKARGSTLDPTGLKETTAEDWTKWYKQQLAIYETADVVALAATESIISKFRDPATKDPIDRMVETVEVEPVYSDSDSMRRSNPAAKDLQALLDDWDLTRSKLFLHGDGSQGLAGNSNSLSSAGFSSFLMQSTASCTDPAECPLFSDDDGLSEFADEIDRRPWMSLSQLAFEWVRKLLEHNSRSVVPPFGPYETSLWPEELKKNIVLLLVNQDEFIYQDLSRRNSEFHQSSAAATSEAEEALPNASEETSIALVQTVFELHLDIYSRIINPSSEVDLATRTLQRDRLCRWASLASMAINGSSWTASDQSWQLLYRFLWASVVANNLLQPSTGTYTVTCFQHLIQQFKADSETSKRPLPVIKLPNNAIMPEISVDAAEREVSRLTTMDFFTSIFSSSDDDPVSVIEKLEPLLLMTVRANMPGSPVDSSLQRNDGDGVENPDGPSDGEAPPTIQDPRLQEALHFLNRASLSMRLVLWQRLQDAYSIVNYPPQILACNLWSLISIVRHIEASTYVETSNAIRQESLLRWLNTVDELMTQTLALASTNPSAFESVDNDHIVSSMEAVASLQRLLHTFGTWEDKIRVGKAQLATQPSSAASKAQSKSAEKFREMIVKTWTLQYVLIKEAMIQNQDVDISNDELIKYLSVAHNILGLRAYCGLGNKMFLKLSKAELLQMKDAEGWDSEMPQVVFDLYGLKISSTPADMQDHSCEPIELDRSTALEILDLVLLHVHRLSIRDLLKNDLRFAVDKMQQVIRVPKSGHATSARTFNKRLVLNYLKAPISPVDLYRSLRGIGELCSTPARTEGWAVAAKGWYFLLGHIALTKFRSQKRITAGSIEDLENAKMFFKQDLEFETERWETWYRLAQVFDTQIDESITWTAEKLETDKDGLVALQRQAILCYTMAVSVAKRCEEPSFEDASKIASLYADFGIRLYACTREPLNGKAFLVSDFKKQFSGETRGMYEGLPFRPMSLYSVWKVSSVLLRQAAKQRPDDWYISYVLGKVLWKMHRRLGGASPFLERLDYQPAIDAIVLSLKCVPEKRDTRHPEKDPILEPHYKLVSMVHKLVRTKSPGSSMSAEAACHLLKATPYSHKVPDIQDSEDWEEYVLAVLKALRSADKSNWHHRMVVRAAHIIYDENPNDMLAVIGAKHELREQIFTKTMTIQVWKPDNERAGRHFVYTGRYVLFFAELLAKTKDKESMESLARRIRRKTGDFADHTKIWTEYSTLYLGLLREMVPVPRGYEESVFKTVDPEDFAINAARLESWILAPTTKCQHIDILRDAMEFKKINNTLIDKAIIEDLIADTYARIYDQNVDDLKAKETAEGNRVRMSVDNILTNPTPPASTADPSSVLGIDAQGPVKRRIAIVTRRQIILKAEALMVKPAPIATPKHAPRPLAPMPDPGQSPALAVFVANYTKNDETLSAPASVHDSADDESELSEIEDVEDPDVEQQPGKEQPKPKFFPNLLEAKADEDDGESNLDEDIGPASANEEGDAAEEELDLDSEPEEPATPEKQGHVASEGFMSLRKPIEEQGENETED